VVQHEPHKPARSDATRKTTTAKKPPARKGSPRNPVKLKDILKPKPKKGKK
jgi:hypothetical protein